MKLSFDRGFIVFFAMIIAGVIVLGVMNFNANRTYFEGNQWVEHTNEVLKEAGTVLNTLQGMAVRGYMMTGDTSFLDQYKITQKTIIPQLDHLAALVKDNPAQNKRVDSLRVYAREKMAIAEKYIYLYDHYQLDATAMSAFSAVAKGNTDQIRKIVADITNSEESLLVTRRAANEKNRSDFNLSVALIFAEIVILLIGTLAAVVFYMRNRKKFEKDIVLLNSQLAQNLAELNKAHTELESFSYSVSHDLRAPLRIIDGFAKIMAEEYKSKIDDEGKRFIETIRSNAQYMGQLIDDLLSFSRISRQDLSIYDTEMKLVVDHVIESFKILNKNFHADIEIESIKNVRCDENLIRQVWMNLLSNAIKYSRMREKPVIRIGTTETPQEVIFYIKDNGVGFDMQFSGKLFGVFQRLHKPSEYEGTGVGLALVNRIVTRHKGRVWAEAKENEGATFYFSIPK